MLVHVHVCTLARSLIHSLTHARRRARTHTRAHSIYKGIVYGGLSCGAIFKLYSTVRNNFIQSHHPPSYPSAASCHVDAITRNYCNRNIPTMKVVSQKHFTTIYLYLSLFQNVQTEVINAWSYTSTSYICLYAMKSDSFTFY